MITRSSILNIKDQQAVNIRKESRGTRKKESMKIREIQTIMNTVSDAVIIMDVENKIQFMNTTAEILLHGCDDDVRDKPFESVIQLEKSDGNDQSPAQTGNREPAMLIWKQHMKIPIDYSWDRFESGRIFTFQKSPASAMGQSQTAESEMSGTPTREIHHRVNNNLQIISSLLHLQSFQFSDKKVLDSIQESQDRIRTMSILHEMLYQSGDSAYIDFEAYIRRLIKPLMRQFKTVHSQVQIQLQIESFPIDFENAVYCGLIINELTSNALKYGFPGDTSGKISISFQRTGPGQIALQVKNNGIKIPDGIDIKTAKSLGLRLVRLLAEKQMQGTLSLETTRETVFTITLNEKLLNP